MLRIAGDLRSSMTPAEKVLLDKIRNKQIKGFGMKIF
jgi:hypothetical protein